MKRKHATVLPQRNATTTPPQPLLLVAAGVVAVVAVVAAVAVAAARCVTSHCSWYMMVDQKKQFQFDNINLASGFVIKRSNLVRRIIDTAETGQHVVLSSPPATGKSSLITLVEEELESRSNEGPVYVFTPSKIGTANEFLHLLHSKSIPTNDFTEIKKVSKTWIIVDDAHRGYREEYDDVWTSLVKDFEVNKQIKVIIAATHTMTTLDSPADISALPHVFDNVSNDEVTQMIRDFCASYVGYERWSDYWIMVKELSLLTQTREEADATNKPMRFHVGVVVKCLARLPELSKDLDGEIDETRAMGGLRHRTFIDGLRRCFAVNEEMISDLLNSDGSFSCQAANWFYNLIHFEGRAMTIPGSIEDLVEKAVGSLSSERLKGCLQGGLFPLETSFQHLLNETMTMHLPVTSAVKPEYRTKAQGFLGNDRRGFIDFYVNDRLQWAIELLRQGQVLQEHRNRFHPINGKYRELPTKEYLVVDIRGPKEAGAVSPRHDICVLYFSAQWDKCVIQMRLMADTTVDLSLR
jgi:hypothetical protein